MYWIKFMDSRNPKIGYNLTEGGGGSSGIKQSEEHIRKAVKARKGFRYPKERSQKISDALTGIKRSEEHKQILSKLKGRLVIQLDLITKKELKTFPSIIEASKETGGAVGSCLRGKCKTAGGFGWKYAEGETRKVKEEILNSKRYKEGYKKISEAKSISIIQLDPITEEELKTFPSLKEAAEFVGLSGSSTICACLNGYQKTAGGNKWRYAIKKKELL